MSAFVPPASRPDSLQRLYGIVLASQNNAVPTHATAMGAIRRGRPKKQSKKATTSVRKMGLCHDSTH
jgi:hypothetical protein